MARITRNSKLAADAEGGDLGATAAAKSGKKYVITPAENARYLFVLPKGVGNGAKIMMLPDPRSGKMTRYLVDGEKKALWQFVAVEKGEPRSWLVEDRKPEDVPGEKTEEGQSEKLEKKEEKKEVIGEDKLEEGSKKEEANSKPTSKPMPTPGTLSIISSPTLHIATPFDPIFLLISTLYNPSTSSAPSKPRYLSFDDHLDALPSTPSHLQTLLRHPTLRLLFESRLSAISLTSSFADETMYAISEEKILILLLEKARRFSDGLPKSMEDKFVTKALEAPMSFATLAPGATIDENGNVSTPGLSSGESPSRTPTIHPSITSLQRLAVAWNYITTTYLPASFAVPLKTLLSASVSFAPLDEYLGALSASRAEATAARNTEMAKKHPLEDAEDRVAEKRQKADERRKAEEMKKKLVTRGVKNLEKVNTAGMKKMTAFFKKV